MRERRSPLSDEEIQALLADVRSNSMSYMGRSISTRTRTVSRVLSLLLCAYYVSWASQAVLPLARVLAGLLLPMAIVWFPDAMARGSGRLGVGHVIRRQSSPRAVLAFGWALLLTPFWIPPIARLLSS